MTVDKIYEICDNTDSNTLLIITDDRTHNLLGCAPWCQTANRLLNKKVVSFFVSDNGKPGHAGSIKFFVE